MNKHKKILNRLYDYLHNEISTEDCRKLENHLASCQSCADELEKIKSIIQITSPLNSPSSKRPQEYWNNFSFEVERRIRLTGTQKTKAQLSIWEKLYTFLALHKRPTLAYSSGLALLILAMTIWRLNITPTPEQIVEQPIFTNEFAKTDDRIEQYFRKSKILLVGITNMDLDRDQPIDLSTERKVSRQLVQEARNLQRQPLDIRSAQLINDLEKILIELANMKEKNDLPNIEIIQGGISKDNLLFKIRMAESVREQSRFINANYITEGERQ